MSNVYIVNHPHDEPSYGRSPIGTRLSIGWNTSNRHKRKFIKRSGNYLNGSTVHNADIYFWGEYEASSECTVVSKNRPKAIHDVLIPARGVSPIPTSALNTDPYVFGNHFKHICCGMRKNGGKYQPGDVILFGKVSYDNTLKKHFMFLDTVFVVKDIVKVNMALNNTQYYKAGIEPIYGKYDIFYRGVTYSPEEKYFSFVPCKTDYSQGQLPKIDLTSLSFTINKQFNSWRAIPINLTNSVWNTIINEVLKSGWKLGIHIDKI